MVVVVVVVVVVVEVVVVVVVVAAVVVVVDEVVVDIVVPETSGLGSLKIVLTRSEASKTKIANKTINVIIKTLLFFIFAPLLIIIFSNFDLSSRLVEIKIMFFLKKEPKTL